MHIPVIDAQELPRTALRKAPFYGIPQHKAHY